MGKNQSMNGRDGDLRSRSCVSGCEMIHCGHCSTMAHWMGDVGYEVEEGIPAVADAVDGRAPALVGGTGASLLNRGTRYSDGEVGRVRVDMKESVVSGGGSVKRRRMKTEGDCSKCRSVAEL